MTRQKYLLASLSIVNLQDKLIVSQLHKRYIQKRHCFSCLKHGSIRIVTNYEMDIN